MLFNSIQFIIFLPIVLLLYQITKKEHRWIILLAASYYFYMSWNPTYIILIIFSTIVDYYAAIKISETNSIKKKKGFIALSLISNLTLLFTFKYFDFISNSINNFFGIFQVYYDPLLLNLILPVGISFYTFQTISYTLDVYNNKIKPEKHLGKFALFVTFFPQLVAGPIERAKDLIPQVNNLEYIKSQNLFNGFKLILWGFFLKLVIADRAGIIVSQVYNNIHSYTGIPIILATFIFSFQLFGDFAGYSLIAIGAGKMMGFNLINNFKRPYIAKNPAEFWKRWHISLTRWFQDYVFNPLYFKISKLKFIKNKSTKIRHFVTFVITIIIGEALLGLWHGANWTFMFFGLYHGALLILYHIFKKWWNKIYSTIQIIITFILVSISWIFFRANNISDVIYIFKNIFVISIPKSFNDIYVILSTMNAGIAEIGILGLAILILFLITILEERKQVDNITHLFNKHPQVEGLIYIILLLIILLFGTFNSTQFIYFQF